ncbi:MAG TPA: Mur ligase family protein [Pirellulaceae bacterium]|nr:Mur ligase family protein [Pirellulaceae bacterium]
MHQLSSPRRIALTELPMTVRGSGVESFRFGSCSAAWRQVEPDDLFVALASVDGDGHDDIEQAVARGASAILAERLVPASVPVFVVEDTREAYGHLCHLLADRPSRDLHLIGVAGSSGKTSVVRLIESVLREAGRPAAVASDERWFVPDPIDASIDDEGYELLENDPAPNDRDALPAPTPPRIVSGLSDAAACGFRHAVLELGAFELARRTWAGTELDVVVLTGLTEDYRGRHNNTANYRKAIRRALGLLRPDGMVIANADCPHVRQLLDELPFPALTYALRSEGAIEGERLEETAWDQLVAVRAGCETIPLRLTRPGDHVAENALAAITLGLSLGIDLPTIVRGIEKGEPADGTLETVSRFGQGPRVLLDRATLPDRVEATLDTLRRTAAGRVWCVCQVDKSLAQEHRSSLGSLVERHSDRAALSVAPELRHRALPVLHDVLDGYEREARDLVSPDTLKALAWVLDQADENDTVVVIGAWEQDREAIERLVLGNGRELLPPMVGPRAATGSVRESHDLAGPRILKIDDFRRSA